MQYAYWHDARMEITHTTVDSTILQIKFDNLTMQEKAELYTVRVLGLIAVIMVLVISPVLIVTYMAMATLAVIALAIIYSWLFKISQTVIRPQEGLITKLFAHPIFATSRQFDIQKYEIVTSKLRMGRGGANWISVLLSGRYGSIEIARFGPKALITEGHKSDHPQAKLLRSQLASQLGLRDCGVM